MSGQARTDARTPTLGRDMGPAGRTARALAGAWLVLAGARTLVEAPRLRPIDIAAVAVTVLAFTALYTVLVRALGRRVLPGLNPWTATSILLTPVVVLSLTTIVAEVPMPLLAGAFVYVGASLLLTSVTGYGGCEVVGVPMLLLRRHDTVYCPLNAVDAAERPFRHRASLPQLAAAALAVVAGIYYFLLQDVLDIAGVHPPIDARWPVVLLLPALVVLTRRAARGVRDTGWTAMTEETRSHGIGALAFAGTAAGLLAFGTIFFAYLIFLVGIYAGGVIAGVRQLRHR